MQTLFVSAAEVPTVYICGDSTAQTYSDIYAPQQGWGQRISEFFTSDVTFVNKAIGGRSSKSFVDEGRLDEVLSLIQEDDYMFIQWGINDRY
jgi:lysophospholipase L1-like esterase